MNLAEVAVARFSASTVSSIVLIPYLESYNLILHNFGVVSLHSFLVYPSSHTVSFVSSVVCFIFIVSSGHPAA